MMNWGKCDKCKIQCDLSTHKCYEYEYRIEDYHGEDDWDKAFGVNAEELALRIAENHDSGEYDLLNGGETIVFVRSRGEVRKYKIEGRLDPTYIATELAV